MIKRSELLFTFFRLPLDIVMIVLAFIIAYNFRLQIDTSTTFANTELIEYLKFAIYICPAWIALFALNGLYAFKNRNGVLADFYKIIISSSTAILILIVIMFLAKVSFFSRIILVSTWVVSIVLITIGRMILRTIQLSMIARGIGRTRLLVVGDNEVAGDLVSEIKNKKLYYYELVGVLADSAKKTNLDKIGNFSDFGNVIKNNQIDEVVLVDQSIPQEQVANLIQLCYDFKVQFKFIPDIYSLMSLNFKPALLGTLPVMELNSLAIDGWGRIIKRVMDILFSLFLVILLSPVLLAIAILIKLTSRGPILYAHERVGRDEKPFKFYKFRSMYIDKSDFQGGVYWTTKNDDKTRITPVGRILRKTNLDELPQLWNILIGDMSFVGPRPEFPKHVERFEKEIPDYFRRHRVKTGLTGWAAVNGLKGDTSIEERVRYDIYYIENWSLWFDLKIIIKTFWLIVYEAFAGKIEYSSRSRVDN